MAVKVYRFPATRPVNVDLSFVAGDVDVLVPEGVTVRIRGEVDVGVADIFGERYEGRNIRFNDLNARKGLTDGLLIVDVDGGLGSFDATWAYWVDDNIRAEERRRERRERRIQGIKERRRDARERREARQKGRDRDR